MFVLTGKVFGQRCCVVKNSNYGEPDTYRFDTNRSEAYQFKTQREANWVADNHFDGYCLVAITTD
jgi:Uma2 family endonuclease